MTASKADNNWLADAADRCVACGLCIPQCPTWQEQRNEAHSPRGRIMLIRQLAAGNPVADSEYYLDACLGCGRCEQICPVKLPFTAMLTKAKARLPARQPWLAKLLIGISSRRWREALLNSGCIAVAILRRLGVVNLLPRRVRTLTSLVPRSEYESIAIAKPKANLSSAATGKRIALLSGCFNRTLDGEAMAATVALLAKCGYQISIPVQQQCCGALPAHAGNEHLTQHCQHINESVFTGVDKIVTTASACAHFLRSQDNTLASRSGEAGELIAQTKANFQPKNSGELNILVHQPCSQSLLPNQGQWIYDLLSDIPDTNIITAPGNDTCCGAGGLNFLIHEQTATKLADRKISLWQKQSQPNTVIVSANHGCRAHLRNALRRAAMKHELIHPLTLFARKLRD